MKKINKLLFSMLGISTVLIGSSVGTISCGSGNDDNGKTHEYEISIKSVDELADYAFEVGKVPGINYTTDQPYATNDPANPAMLKNVSTQITGSDLIGMTLMSFLIDYCAEGVDYNDNWHDFITNNSISAFSTTIGLDLKQGNGEDLALLNNFYLNMHITNPDGAVVMGVEQIIPDAPLIQAYQWKNDDLKFNMSKACSFFFGAPSSESAKFFRITWNGQPSEKKSLQYCCWLNKPLFDDCTFPVVP